MKTHLLIFLSLLAHSLCAQYNWTPGGWFAPAKAVDFALALNGNLYAACHVDNNYKAILLRSTDNGNNWTDITDVSYPADDYPFSIACVGNNILLAGSSVSISTDGGSVFSPANSSLPFAFEPAELLVTLNGDVFLVGSELSGPANQPRLYKSTNGGTNWSQVIMNGIPSHLERPGDIINLNSKLVMTVEAWSTGGGSVYISSDGGQNWTPANITVPDPSQFYRSTTFARGPDNALYLVGDHLAPATLPLFVSNDEGLTWTPVNHNGLTNFFVTGGFIKPNGPYLLGGQIAGGSQFDYVVYRSNHTVGLDFLNGDTHPALYPNPANDHLGLNKSSSATIQKLRLINAQGAVALEERGVTGTVEVSRLSPGIYTAELEDDRGVATIQRLIIQR